MENKEGPVVYVSSPFHGDIEGNVRRTRKYSAFALSRGACPVNPILNLLGVLSEDTDREEAMRADLRILTSGGISELWCFGEPSPGMMEEMEAARDAGIPARWFTKEMEEVGHG